MASPMAQGIGVHNVAHDLGQAEPRLPRHDAVVDGAAEADTLPARTEPVTGPTRSTSAQGPHPTQTACPACLLCGLDGGAAARMSSQSSTRQTLAGSCSHV